MSKTHKKFTIVGNWKMNPDTLDEARVLFSALSKKATKNPDVSVVIIPPSPFISSLSGKKNQIISIGTQDVSGEERGAFTGSVSGTQTASSGATYALIGHSERRAAGDTDAVIAQKTLRALDAGMKVILCVGEKERDEHAYYLRAIREQILFVINALPDKKKVKNITIAYEPVWAIGKSFDLAPKPADIHEMVLYIKKVAIEVLGKADGLKLKVLYGGSVNSENAEAMLCESAIDGLLIGRQSLDAESFATIIDYANNL